MCGIICQICSDSRPDSVHHLETNIKNRGPDFYGTEEFKINEIWNGFFSASVLHTQGKELAKQPLRSSENDVLLWNGDIFDHKMTSDTGHNLSDTELLFKWLEENHHCILELPTLIEGPYSFIYYNNKKNELWFGRDILGRHSLLWSMNADNLLITSVGHRHIENLREVPAIGIFCFNLNQNELLELHLHPWSHIPKFLASFDLQLPECMIARVCENPINTLNFNVDLLEDEPHEAVFASKVTNSADVLQIMENLLENDEIRNRVEILLQHLSDSCRKRVTVRRNVCKNCNDEDICSTNHVKLGILFSGGLDSTLIAYLVDKYVPAEEPIDLLNVAFNQKGSFDVPDRKTGLTSLEELRDLCPDRRWNFVEINVGHSELEYMRKTHICHLIYPLETVLDDSLGCALWFACRGRGAVNGCSYTSTAKVILLGNGADEQLGGYTRHRNILNRNGWKDLANQLLKETLEISKRNLGRDNRVACDSGRQPRFPFLDEQFVKYVSHLPPWEKCDPVSFPRGLGDKLILRLAALQLGLRRCATFPKRAFQFGCRIAKSKEKGDNKSIRL